MAWIALNGERREVEAGSTIADLMRDLALEDRPCAIELNQVLIARVDRAFVGLQDGDTVEIVTLVGGG